jgi:HAE1 family hydrophobic/amphiphilic exporter-1
MPGVSDDMGAGENSGGRELAVRGLGFAGSEMFEVLQVWNEAGEGLGQRGERVLDSGLEGYWCGFGAEVEQQAQAFNQLRVLLILGVLLVYAVMASQYESLRDPVIVMFSVPVAAIGVVGALKLTSTSFSLQAYIGVIMLGGIVVSNAILLVDYTNILRRRDGMALREAVEVAGRTRLRPILMTTLTTILGLVPMALALGEGSELQAPLARVVIGGLTASTLVTLVLVPAVYTLFEEGLSGLRRTPAQPQPERA